MRQANVPTGRAAAFLLAVASLVAMIGGAVRESRAEGLSGYLEYNYSFNEGESVDSGGRSTHTRSGSLSQSYNLTLDKRLYPNLRLLASGTFRRTDSENESDGNEIDVTSESLRPNINLTLQTPLYKADAAFSRSEERTKVSGAASLTTVRDLAFASLYWKPDKFPEWKFFLSRDNLYDKERATVDTVTDLFQLTSNYRPVEPLALYYQGTYRTTEQRISGIGTEEVGHNGRASYFNSWWRRRITFSADYNIRHLTIDTEATGTGEVAFPVFAVAGLSALSDVPDNVALLSNPALVDGSFTAGTGINLGLPPPGGDARARNLGLDFAVATETNTLLVFVDRDVSQVAGAFSWRIYTSGNNLNWTLRTIVPPVIFSPAFNRFEIRFANVSDRFVKVVVSPLTPAVPLASLFPDIQVTEIQAEIRRPASEAAGRVSSTFQTGSANFRAILLESIGFTYDLGYFFTKRDHRELEYTVTSGLSCSKQFNRVFSGNGRIGVEYASNQDGYREALLFNTSVTALPIPALQHTLSFSGRVEDSADGRNSEASTILYNNARLYEGIDANLSAGISFRESEAGTVSRTTLLNSGMTFVPNRKVTLSLFYNGTGTESSGGDLQGSTRTTSQAGEANLLITPVPTVNLFGSYRIESIGDAQNRNILNYSLNWSPFPDGTVHFTFFYNETVRSDDLKDRTISPNVRWYFIPRAYLQLTYQNSKSESPAQASSTDVYSGTVRINF